MPKGKNKTVQTELLIDEKIPAPIKKGDRVGCVRYISDGNILDEGEITASEEVEKISFLRLFYRMIGIFCLK